MKPAFSARTCTVAFVVSTYWAKSAAGIHAVVPFSRSEMVASVIATPAAFVTTQVTFVGSAS